jgi:hypothetical protein
MSRTGRVRAAGSAHPVTGGHPGPRRQPESRRDWLRTAAALSPSTSPSTSRLPGRQGGPGRVPAVPSGRGPAGAAELRGRSDRADPARDGGAAADGRPGHAAPGSGATAMAVSRKVWFDIVAGLPEDHRPLMPAGIAWPRTGSTFAAGRHGQTVRERMAVKAFPAAGSGGVAETPRPARPGHRGSVMAGLGLAMSLLPRRWSSRSSWPGRDGRQTVRLRSPGALGAGPCVARRDPGRGRSVIRGPECDPGAGMRPPRRGRQAAEGQTPWLLRPSTPLRGRP